MSEENIKEVVPREVDDDIEQLLMGLLDKLSFLSTFFYNLEGHVEIGASDFRGVGLVLEDISTDIRKITDTI